MDELIPGSDAAGIVIHGHSKSPFLTLTFISVASFPWNALSPRLKARGFSSLVRARD